MRLSHSISTLKLLFSTPFVCLSSSTFYARWPKVFLLTVDRYSVEGHVLSDVSAPTRPAWIASCGCGSSTPSPTSSLMSSLSIAPAPPNLALSHNFTTIVKFVLYSSTTTPLTPSPKGSSTSQTSAANLKGMADTSVTPTSPVPTTTTFSTSTNLNNNFEAIEFHPHRGCHFPSFADLLQPP